MRAPPCDEEAVAQLGRWLGCGTQRPGGGSQPASTPCVPLGDVPRSSPRLPGRQPCRRATPTQEVPPGQLSRLRDARPLPPGAFPDPAALFAAEGETYNLLFRLLLNALAHSKCAANPAASLLLPPGWRLEAAANLSQGGSPPLPLVYVLSQAQRGQLVFLARGTLSTYEWSLNAMYNQVSRAAPPAAGVPVRCRALVRPADSRLGGIW